MYDIILIDSFYIKCVYPIIVEQNYIEIDLDVYKKNTSIKKLFLGED